MNKQTIFSIAVLAVTAVMVTGCGGPKRHPGRTYMPDMAYSRAYESYPDLDTSIFTENEAMAGGRIYYDRKPVAGTVKRGLDMIYHGGNDSTSFNEAKTLANPLPDTSMSKVHKEEAERLYNVYCGVCHGANMEGGGPVSKKWGGAPANLTLEKFWAAQYPDGQLFHTITYGKNQMGGYASQLNTNQRWMVVNYIRSKQKARQTAAAPKAGGADTTGKAAPKQP